MQWASYSNEYLVIQLQKQFDEQIFEELFGRFMPLYRKQYQKYRINYFEFDDYLQEARLSLLKVIETYSASSKYYVASYYARIFENRLLNCLRHQSAKKRDYQNMTVYLEDMIEASSNGDTELTYSDLVCENKSDLIDIIIARDAFTHLMAELSELERKILGYRLMEEAYSVTEIAEKLAIDKKSVENALSRCRQKCKALLK